jgi:hypothetical protein
MDERKVWLVPDNLAFLVPADMSTPQQVAWLAEQMLDGRHVRVGLLSEDEQSVEEVTRKVN